MSKRVLIADDSQSVSDAVCTILQTEIDVEICATTFSGIETVNAAIALRPDIIVLDLLLPGLTGLEIAGILKTSLPSAKIVLFTLYADIISSRTAAILDIPVISKSEGLSGLVEVLKSYLDDDLDTSFLPEQGAA